MTEYERWSWMMAGAALLNGIPLNCLPDTVHVRPQAIIDAAKLVDNRQSRQEFSKWVEQWGYTGKLTVAKVSDAFLAHMEEQRLQRFRRATLQVLASGCGKLTTEEERELLAQVYPELRSANP